MGVKAGLVGLPNVGKSTLFNALTKSNIPAENYPFCTIDPHVAMTSVPDERLEKLATIFGSQKLIPNHVSIVDIAGLVKGASTGEGLGNQFLSHIREVDLILHVLRCFDDSNIIHTSGTVDPLSDFEVIVSELMLKDLESISKRLERIPASLKKSHDAQEKKLLEGESRLLIELQAALEQGDGQKARTIIQTNPTTPTIPLLSTKNFLIIANMSEDEIGEPEKNIHYQRLISAFGPDRVIPVSANLERELSVLEPEAALDFMNLLGLSEYGVNAIIRKTFQELGLITFFTCGPKRSSRLVNSKGDHG